MVSALIAQYKLCLQDLTLITLSDADALAQLQTTLMGSNQYAELWQNTALQAVFQPLHLLTQFNDPNHIYAYSELPY